MRVKRVRRGDLNLSIAAVAVAAAVCLGQSGCGDATAIAPNLGPQGTGNVAQWDDLNLEYSIEALENLPRYANVSKFSYVRERDKNKQPTGRIQKDHRKDVQKRLAEWVETGEPALAWTPSPTTEMRQEIVDRLNQWIRSQEETGTWSADPIIEELSGSLRELSELQAVDALKYTRYDGQVLEQTVWLRDLSNHICRGGGDDLEKAAALFDWTVRNIAPHARQC